jgi:hypothetical protein
MDEIDDLLSSLHDHLEATQEMALPEDANRLLGEAQSIAADLAEGDVDHETAHERTQAVLELLDELDDGTGNDDADDHVEAARRAAERVLER